MKLLSVVGFASIPAVSMAAPTLSDVLDASGITATGYVSGGYQTNFNNGSTLGARTFDSKTDSFTLNQAALTVSKLPTEGFGALANVILGDDAKVINSSYNASESNNNFSLTQAYLQYATGNFTVIGGRFVTLAGYEVINDSLNPHISRSLLFTAAEPLVHTGVRTSYKFSDIVTGYLGVNNSAVSGDATDTNKQKTLEVGVALTPTTPLSIGIYDYYGFDSSGDPSGSSRKTNFLDVVAAYKISDAFTVGLNGDYAKFFSVGEVLGSSVTGVAGYASYQFTDQWGLRGRAEYVKFKADGTPDNDVETYTVTGVYSPAKSFDLLAEVRYDKGKESVFPDGLDSTGLPQTKDSQGDVAIKAIYKF
jgi:hypothetical protein